MTIEQIIGYAMASVFFGGIGGAFLMGMVRECGWKFSAGMLLFMGFAYAWLCVASHLALGTPLWGSK